MPRHTYKYYDFIMAAFVTVLLCSNLMGATKVVSIYGFTFGAGVFFFPISYLCGDILTEVYGYAPIEASCLGGFERNYICFYHEFCYCLSSCSS